MGTVRENAKNKRGRLREEGETIRIVGVCTFEGRGKRRETGKERGRIE